MGAQAPLVVPPQFFGGQPAHALHETALDLADVDGRIQRGADVVQDVDPLDPVFAGERVDGDLRGGGAIGIIVEGAPAAGLAVPIDIRGAIEAGGGELDAVAIDLLDEIRPPDLAIADTHAAGQEFDLVSGDAVLFHGVGDHALLDVVAGIERCHSVEIGAGGGRRRRGVGHLGGGGRRDLDHVEIDLEGLCHHLGDLDVEALAHLGAAMVHAHRTVGIDVHQRAGLVLPAIGEGDAELHRCQRDAATEDAALGILPGILCADFGAPGLVVAGCLELGDDLGREIRLDCLVIGGEVAAGPAIEVELADIERILAGGIGHFLDQALGTDRPLWSAETAEGGVGDGMGSQGLGVEAYGRIEIGVVGMEERAVGHRAGKVGREAAAGGEQDIDSQDVAFIVEADFVIDHEIVALAGGDHVVVAVGPELDRPAGAPCRQRGDGGEDVALGFLAAEPAAHAADLAGDGVARHIQHMRHRMLDLAGMLGGGIEGDVAVLARHGEGDVAFQIEVLLAAEIHRALDAPRRSGHRRIEIAAIEAHRLGDEVQAAGGLTVLTGGGDVENRRQFLIADLGLGRGQARFVAGAGDHGEDRLAVEHHLALGEDRVVVMVGGADVVDAGNVGGREHQLDAGAVLDSREVDLLDQAMGAVRQAERGMQQAGRFGHVVDVERLAGHVLVTGIVAGGLIDAAGDLIAIGCEDGLMHGRHSGGCRQPGERNRSRSRPGNGGSDWRRPSIGSARWRANRRGA